MPNYDAVPASQSYAPSRRFRREQEALDYAREAAATFRVRYAVWERRPGRFRLVKAFPAGRRRA